VVTVRKACVLGVLATALLATGPAFGDSTRAANAKPFLTLTGATTASTTVAISKTFSLRGVTVSAKGTFAGYELKNKAGALVSWGLRLPDGHIVDGTVATSFPAGSYQVTLLANGAATVNLLAATSATHKTVSPRTHADFAFATQTASSPGEDITRVPFTVPQHYSLVLHVDEVARGFGAAGYETDCITTGQICNPRSGTGDVRSQPFAIGSDAFTYEQFYYSGTLVQGAANAVAEYVAAGETAKLTSSILVFS
jgi:hypothetical protein